MPRAPPTHTPELRVTRAADAAAAMSLPLLITRATGAAYADTPQRDAAAVKIICVTLCYAMSGVDEADERCC